MATLVCQRCGRRMVPRPDLARLLGWLVVYTCPRCHDYRLEPRP